MCPVPLSDPTLPPPLDAYWLERMHDLWMDLYTAAFFLHGPSAAEQVKSAQGQYEDAYVPEADHRHEGGY